ncbi:hypothetical protein [Mitsuaria sp. GD03876]|uniref:hypothetical protein n=1 Tax=Mitsuaria sp. GD03876 TaxID=2975399 RepID=UPI00244700CB|nr:hypothetical protein [Mitsuaria sp. GD03876]MDH0863375.1 hypothetical protein [Mitsuaria sp. GD03876]
MPKSLELRELEALVEAALQRCTPDQRDAFSRYRVPFYEVPIRRGDALERVHVVAHLPLGLLYYEDVEEGFEVSTLAADGAIAEPGANQFDLRHILFQMGHR